MKYKRNEKDFVANGQLSEKSEKVYRKICADLEAFLVKESIYPRLNSFQ